MCVREWAADNNCTNNNMCMPLLVLCPVGLLRFCQQAEEKRRQTDRVSVGMVFTFVIVRMRKSGVEDKKHYIATVIDIDEQAVVDPTAFPHRIQYVDGQRKPILLQFNAQLICISVLTFAFRPA